MVIFHSFLMFFVCLPEGIAHWSIIAAPSLLLNGWRHVPIPQQIAAPPLAIPLNSAGHCNLNMATEKPIFNHVNRTITYRIDVFFSVWHSSWKRGYDNESLTNVGYDPVMLYMGYPQILPKSPEYKYISCSISATPKRQKYVSTFLCLWGCYLGVHPNEGCILGVCLTYGWLMNHIIYGYGLLQSE